MKYPSPTPEIPGATAASFKELGRIVRRDGPLPPERAVALVRRAARALTNARATGHCPDTRSQVFGLGVLLFFALTGKAPLEAESIEPMDSGLRPSLFSPHPVCSALDAVVRTCLRDMRGEGFSSASELDLALAALPYAEESSRLESGQLARGTAGVPDAGNHHPIQSGH